MGTSRYGKQIETPAKFLPNSANVLFLGAGMVREDMRPTYNSCLYAVTRQDLRQLGLRGSRQFAWDPTVLTRCA